MSGAGKGERSAPHPFDYVTRDQIQDLWGIGYTIVKRSRHVDPFHVPAEMIPQGRAYQWWHLIHDRVHFHRDDDPKLNSTGWAAVPASRHDGYFMPFGTVGPIEVGGLGLFEKSKVEVDQERAAQVAAVKKQTDDWAKDLAADGLSGSFSIGGVETKVGKPPAQFKRSDTKTIETTVSVPRDMLPHMAEVFAERDRLYDAVMEADQRGAFADWQAEVCNKYHQAFRDDPNILRGPTFNALLLPIAVENVRAKLKEGKTDE